MTVCELQTDEDVISLHEVQKFPVGAKEFSGILECARTICTGGFTEKKKECRCGWRLVRKMGIYESGHGESEPQLFSAAALAVLDHQTFDPAAKRNFDYMSGGWWWSDEFPDFNSPEWQVIHPGYLYRFLLAYRASITLGEERVEIRPLWEQVARHSPNWPGLRTERWGELALHRLQAALRIQRRCLAKLEAEIDAEK